MRRMTVFCLFLFISFNAAAEKLTGTLKKVAETGVMTIGYNADSFPFSFVDDLGAPAGYSVDLCRRIATATKETAGLKNLDVKFVQVAVAAMHLYSPVDDLAQYDR